MFPHGRLGPQSLAQILLDGLRWFRPSFIGSDRGSCPWNGFRDLIPVQSQQSFELPSCFASPCNCMQFSSTCMCNSM